MRELVTKERVFRFAEILMVLAGIILFSTVLQPCYEGMICKRTVLAVQGFYGVACLGLTALWAMNAPVNKKVGICLLDIFITIILIVAILLPSILGGCKMDTMRCHTVSFPAVVIISTLVAVVNIIHAVYQLLKDKPRK